MTTLRPFTCNDMFKFNNVYGNQSENRQFPSLFIFHIVFHFTQKLGRSDRNIWIIVLHAIFGPLARIFPSRRVSQR